MSTYVLIPGAGGDAWYWHRLAPLLREAGHEVVAVELPAADESAGLQRYADAVVEAVGDRDGRTGPPAEAAGREPGVRDIVLVAQSMGGLTAPLVCDRLPVSRIVLVNAMIPRPGETGGDWWANTGQEKASRELAEREGRDPDAPFDPLVVFFHDAPPEVIQTVLAGPAPEQAGRPFGDPWPLDAWPDVPTTVLSSTGDRLFPVEFQDRIARERLGLTPVRLPGGHLVALTRPGELAQLILRED
jgi:pimeloyl-ACP methyl ester carboxylesterase